MAGKPKKKGRATEIDKHIGKRLRYLRVREDMSQETLAAKVGLTFQQIQKYENGGNRVAAARLFRFSEIFKTTPDVFYVGWKGYKGKGANDNLGHDLPKDCLQIAVLLSEIGDLKSRKTLVESLKGILKSVQAGPENSNRAKHT